MGNCQAIDAATLVVQHPNGKVDKLYWAVTASEIMKMNPGHYVALLITTTVCHTPSKTEPKSNTNTLKNNCSTQKNTSQTTNSRSISSQNSCKGTDSKISSTSTSTGAGSGDGRNTVRITRVKLLRPSDTLALGHVYRLISTQEVMKGLVAKKQAKMRKNVIELADSEGLKEAEKYARKSEEEKTHQVSRHGHRSRINSASNGGTARPKTWQPSLHSISEAAS